MVRKIEIEDMVTVGTLAEKLALPATRLIAELMKNGVMATVNERIDFDTAQIIVEELGLEVELVPQDREESTVAPKTRKHEASDTALPRPPVVAVMGHVDHGKTSLLDAIRGVQTAKHEAGGITQHISACQVLHGKRAITFLDTPGHEAFAAIREHGAHLTDIAIIVVAADDGIKPQTVEAIRFARNAGVKMLVAINKMDKDGADPNRVKQQLSEQGLLIEEWGGDTVAVEVSALKGSGISQLLDMVLLIADVEDLRADVEVPASGLIIEARFEQGRGPVAHVLIESGTLRIGDYVTAGNAYAKVRVLETMDGKRLTHAAPAMPVIVTGFKTLPAFGDEFQAAASEKQARAIAEQSAARQRSGTSLGNLNSSELIRMINRKNKMQELNVIIRADVQGSLTSIIDSLKALETDEVAIRVVSSGIGAITENDLQRAATSGAIIYGFNVALPSNIKRLAAHDKVTIRLYNVIYELIDDAKERLSSLLAPGVVETDLGRLIVRGVFKTTKTEGIFGGEVTKGKLTAPALARIMRSDEQIAEVEVTNLRRGPQEAKEVLEGEMCGVAYKTTSRVELQEGDRLEFFTRTVQSRTL